MAPHNIDMNMMNMNMDMDMMDLDIVRPVPHHHRRSVSLPFDSMTGNDMRPRPNSSCGPLLVSSSSSSFYSGAHSGFSSIDKVNIPVSSNVKLDDKANANASLNANANATSGSFILNAQSQIQVRANNKVPSDDDEHELDFLHRRSTSLATSRNDCRNGNDPNRERDRDRDCDPPLSLSPFEPLTKDRNYNWPGQKGGKISPLPRNEYEAWSKRREREMEMVAKHNHNGTGTGRGYVSYSSSAFRPVPVSPQELNESHHVEAAKDTHQAVDMHQNQTKTAAALSRHDLMRENHRLQDRIEQLEQMLSRNNPASQSNLNNGINVESNPCSHTTSPECVGENSMRQIPPVPVDDDGDLFCDESVSSASTYLPHQPSFCSRDRNSDVSVSDASWKHWAQKDSSGSGMDQITCCDNFDVDAETTGNGNGAQGSNQPMDGQPRLRALEMNGSGSGMHTGMHYTDNRSEAMREPSFHAHESRTAFGSGVRVGIGRPTSAAGTIANNMTGSFQHSIRASASTTRDQKLSKPNKLSPVLDSESFKGNRYPLYTNAHMNMKNIVESSFSATATRTCAITHTNRICNGNGATSVTFHSARKRPRVDLDALI